MSSTEHPRRVMHAADYARRVGVDASAISHAIRRGEIIPLDSGMIDVGQADATYGRRRAQRAAARGDNAESIERRESALVQRTIAQMAMMQKRAGDLHESVVQRDAGQSDINAMTTDVRARVTFADGPAWAGAAKAATLADLGDLRTEAFRVTRK